MEELIKFRDNYPQLPNDLIPYVYKSIEGTDLFPNASAIFPGKPTYKLYEQPKIIRNWFASEVMPLITSYTGMIEDTKLPRVMAHVITNGSKIHKDLGKIRGLNYILDLGGPNVVTTFYEKDYTKIHSCVLPAFRWHEIQTDVFHHVTNIQTKRVALTIKLK